VQHDEKQAESPEEGLLAGPTLVGSSTPRHAGPGQTSPPETQSTSPTAPSEEISATATNEGVALGVESDSSDSGDDNDLSAIVREQARRKAIKKGKQPANGSEDAAALRTRDEIYKLGHREGGGSGLFNFPNFVARSDERQRSFDEKKRRLEADEKDAAAKNASIFREKAGSRKRPLDLDDGKANEPKTSRSNGGKGGKSDVWVFGTGKRRKMAAHHARSDKLKGESGRRRDKSRAEVGTLHTGLTSGNLLRLEELEALGELSATKERYGSRSHRRPEKNHGKKEKGASKTESRRYYHQHRNRESERSSQQKMTEGKKMDREIVNAIFYNPITASPKAPEHIAKIKAATTEIPKNSRISDIQRGARAFNGLDVAIAQKKKETKAIPYSSSSKSQTHIPLAPAQSHTTQQPKPVTASTSKASNTLQKQRAKNGSQPADTVKKTDKLNSTPNQSPEEPQQSEDPQQLEEQQEQPRPAPQRGLQVQQVLDANQVFRQWVVWHTPRFIPQGCETKKDKARRGPEYQSKSEANSQARAQLERLQKGVAGKTWNHCSNTKATKGEGIFNGHVTFEGGDVQYFWVEEELVDLSMAIKSRKAAGKADILVDPIAAKVYQRKRFDVVSYHIYAVGKEEVEKPAIPDVVKERRGLQSQTVIIDCSGDDEDGDQNGQGGDMASEVGSGTKKPEIRKLSEALYHGDDSESDLESESGSGSGSTSIPMPRPALHHTNNANTANRPGSNDEDEDETSRSLNPLHLTRPRLAIQGSFTTMELANRAAIRIFLDLTKPTDDQPAKDKHYYKYYIWPHYFQLGREIISDESYKTAPVEIIFDPDLTKYKWEFLRLVVEVVESELKGPIDISDMLAQELMITEEAVEPVNPHFPSGSHGSLLIALQSNAFPTFPDPSPAEAPPSLQANNILPAQAADAATADPTPPPVRNKSIFNISHPWADIDSNDSEEE
jgi:hypothetical protein